MSKIEHKITIPVKPGTVLERMETAIDEQKKERKASEAMKKWLTMGFLVSEMGGGILELFLTLEDCGQLQGKTPHETALSLVKMIQSQSKEGGEVFSQLPDHTEGDVGFGDVSQTPQIVQSYD